MITEDIPQKSINGELLSEYEFDLLWAPQANTDTSVAATEAKRAEALHADYSPRTNLPAQKIVAPRGKFYQDKYVPPAIGRKDYIHALQEEAVSTNYERYAPLSSRRMSHVDRNNSLNFYTEEMRRVVPILLHYYGKGELVVINGFRSHWDIGIQAHSVGIALDIQATAGQATRIMNAAYLAGIPTILPGGDFAAGEGYVHLDLAEKPTYTYEAGYYEGPWSR